MVFFPFRFSLKAASNLLLIYWNLKSSHQLVWANSLNIFLSSFLQIFIILALRKIVFVLPLPSRSRAFKEGQHEIQEL